MAELPLTYDALSEVPANLHFGLGQHAEFAVRSTAVGRQLGHTAFNPMLHTPDMIDPFSIIGMAMEQDMVPIVEPARPLTMNIVTDLSGVREYPGVTAAKRAVAHDISLAIDESCEATDQAYLYLIGDNIPSEGLPHHEKIQIAEGDTEALAVNAAEIASNGLSFIISDFRRLNLPRDTQFDNLIAVKVNHSWERELPENVGVVNLGGLVEVNTNKPRQLRSANERLEEMHQATVAELEGHGAQVASVVVMPKSAHKYDVATADQQIADAIRTVTSR